MFYENTGYDILPTSIVSLYIALTAYIAIIDHIYDLYKIGQFNKHILLAQNKWLFILALFPGIQLQIGCNDL